MGCFSLREWNSRGGETPTFTPGVHGPPCGIRNLKVILDPYRLGKEADMRNAYGTPIHAARRRA